MQEYHDIMNAVQLLREARRALSAEDGPNITSPAWTLVTHAQRYLMAHADAVLRGDEYFHHRGELVAVAHEIPMIECTIEASTLTEASSYIPR